MRCKVSISVLGFRLKSNQESCVTQRECISQPDVSREQRHLCSGPAPASAQISSGTTHGCYKSACPLDTTRRKSDSNIENLILQTTSFHYFQHEHVKCRLFYEY